MLGMSFDGDDGIGDKCRAIFSRLPRVGKVEGGGSSENQHIVSSRMCAARTGPHTTAARCRMHPYTAVRFKQPINRAEEMGGGG